MKQTIKKTRMITIGLFTLCTMGLMNVTFAGVKNNDPVELKFIGKINNRPVIQLNLNNKEAGEYFINIKGMNYHILYSEIVNGKNLSRIYKLNLDDDDLMAPGSAVRIEVTSAKTHETEVYKLNTMTGAAENVVAYKL